ncbi:MAG: hypothetical protein LBH58_05165, partial [Tannerellaceae bacterium]|nr:hypothetical protein [Tannerellaceae bacterium]
MSAIDKIFVYADWIPLKTPTLMGVLTASHIKGKEAFSFQYDDAWLKSDKAILLDPDLELFSGFQHLRDEKKNFGIFLDSSPDRWGRVLMKRKEALLAKEENRKSRKLFESDYLLGIYDPLRMGALRFKTDLEGAFLANDKDFTAPLLISPSWYRSYRCFGTAHYCVVSFCITPLVPLFFCF